MAGTLTINGVTYEKSYSTLTFLIPGDVFLFDNGRVAEVVTNIRHPHDPSQQKVTLKFHDYPGECDYLIDGGTFFARLIAVKSPPLEQEADAVIKAAQELTRTRVALKKDLATIQASLKDYQDARARLTALLQ